MPPIQSWSFPPFRLDPATASLWRGDELLPLSPKPFAVLACLVAQAGQVVTKDALLDAAWPKMIVSEGVLKNCIRQVRQALDETAATPQYIATVHRRGYRFIAPVTPLPSPSATAPAAAPVPGPIDDAAPEPQPDGHTPTWIVGREAELAQLHQWWAQAQQGAGQLVFITGEAGIGKTTLVDAFMAQVDASATVWSSRGQCLEHYGAGEAYLPLLEALSHLGRGPTGEHLRALLHQHAPSWLLQLPALVSDAEIEGLQRRVSSATRERMLRELAEAVEVLTAERPLVLVLEDLHWSDVSTLDWLAYIARRRQAARLLVLGTYRPTDAIVHGHPVHAVTQDLRLRGQSAELVLGYLPEAAVHTYLTQRFGEPHLPRGLGRALHQRTSGNPLFLLTVVDALVRQGAVRQGVASWELVGDLEAAVGGVPDSLWQLIDQQLTQLLPQDLMLLEAASVVGKDFTAAVVAAIVDDTVESVEDRCEAFARQGQLLRAYGSTDWPDGTVAGRYAFLHDLYRETLYERVPISRRVRWHLQIGARLEVGYGAQVREIAAELAEHFVRGRDAWRAVPYLYYAGEQALQRSAHQEGIMHFTRGLELLATCPETPARAQHELDLHIALGPALIATKGQAAPEVERTYARARVLCTQVGETPQLLPTVQGLCAFYRNRGALSTARSLGEQFHQLAQRQTNSRMRLEAHVALGMTLFHLGEYAAAWGHAEQGIALINPTAPQVQAHHTGVDPGVQCLAIAANTLWCLGFPAQATQRSQELLDLALTLDHPYSLALARHFTAFLYHRIRDAPMVHKQADALLALATAQGFALYLGYGACYQGWVLAAQGQGAAGMARMRQGLEAFLATGLELSRPLWLAPLAEVAGRAGQAEEGLQLIEEALQAFAAGERGEMLAEAHRLQGELLLRQAPVQVQQAETCFQRALAIASGQQAKSWELRAAMSLARLWQQHGKGAAARQVLAEVYDWFTEGFDTADLQEARALLTALEGGGSGS